MESSLRVSASVSDYEIRESFQDCIGIDSVASIVPDGDTKIVTLNYMDTEEFGEFYNILDKKGFVNFLGWATLPETPNIHMWGYNNATLFAGGNLKNAISGLEKNFEVRRA